MHEALAPNVFLVKEHVGLFKAANNYDIYDSGGRVILHCREGNLGFVTRLLRFTDFKRMTPFAIEIRIPDGEPLIRVTRGIAFIRSTVTVHDEQDRVLGYFRQKLLSIGGRFTVLDAGEKDLCQLVGKWTSWDFRFMAGDRELARITKKWAGLAKEMFTTADTYALEINASVPADSPLRQLILAAVVCVDMVLKE